MARLKDFLSGKKSSPTSPPPYLLHIRSSKVFIITTVCIAVFTDIFLYGIIVPVIPFALSNRAGIAGADVQSWVSILLAAYGATLLVLSPLSGLYSDKSSSRRLPLLIGLLALAGATVMLCLARNVALLIIGRLLQGASAAIVWTVGMALLVDTIGKKDIGQTLGWVSLSMFLGTMIAPLIGGVTYDKAGYYSVYYIAFGLIALDIVLRLALIEKKVALQWTIEDVEETSDLKQEDSQNNPGAVRSTPDETISQDISQEKPNEYIQTIQSPLPVPQPEPEALEAPSKYPPILTLLKSTRLLVALWAWVVQGSLLTAFDSVIPLYVQETFHWISTAAGIVFLALTVPAFLSPLVGWFCDRYGPRWLCVAGFLFPVPFWVLLRLITHDSLGQKVLLCALLALIGTALTLVAAPLMAEITYVVSKKEAEHPGRYGKQGAFAQAYGLMIMAFAAGTLIGPVWAGYVRDAAGWGTMCWSLGVFSMAGAVPCLVWTGGLITKKNKWRSGSGDSQVVEEPRRNPQNAASEDAV